MECHQGKQMFQVTLKSVKLLSYDQDKLNPDAQTHARKNTDPNKDCYIYKLFI